MKSQKAKVKRQKAETRAAGSVPLSNGKTDNGDNMHRNSQKNAIQLYTFLTLRFIRQAVRFIALGINAHQWAACLMICAMVWPLVTPPASVFGRSTAENDLSGFEPVNEDICLSGQAFGARLMPISMHGRRQRPNGQGDTNQHPRRAVGL